MKSIKLILAAVAAMAFASTASAQFVTGGASKSSSSSFGSAFQSVYASYAPTNFIAKSDGSSSTTSYKAVNLGYATDIPVATIENAYYEIGAAVEYAWDKDTENHTTDVTSFLDVKVPLSIVYMLNLSDNLAIAPYAGVDPSLFILGQEKETYSYDGESESETVNYFSKDDMGDYTYNRFVLEWHVGAKVYINNKFYAGVTYQAPITWLYNKDSYKMGYNMTQLTLGLLF